MIIKKEIRLDTEINIDIPLGYEFDTNSSSLVLLDGYRYEIFYKNYKTTDKIDLTREDSNE